MYVITLALCLAWPTVWSRLRFTRSRRIRRARSRTTYYPASSFKNDQLRTSADVTQLATRSCCSIFCIGLTYFTYTSCSTSTCERVALALRLQLILSIVNCQRPIFTLQVEANPRRTLLGFPPSMNSTPCAPIYLHASPASHALLCR